MSNEAPTDERRNYTAVQRVIDVLLEFEPETRSRILQTVYTFFGVGASEPQSKSLKRGESEVPRFSNREELSPKDFLFQKKPKSDVERVTCLAYYLTHFRNTAHFKTTDISKLNTEAAQIKFSNASYAVNNATQLGYLASAAKGTKQISAPGERFVDVLPNRSDARKAMLEMIPRRRTRPIRKNSSMSSATEQTVDG